MEQKDKQLLCKDLCARLPYNVMVKITGDDEPYTLLAVHPNKGMVIIGLNMGDCYATSKVKIDNCLPFLRPMSSMTEEEEIAYLNLESAANITDWLNKYHFDYRCLIKMGLALEAPEGMYKAI